MILEEAAVARSSAIRDEHKSALIARLKDYSNFSWLLGTPNQYQNILQGDFLASFPTVYRKPGGDPVASKQLVMVVNNTCDLQPARQSYVSVAPVFDAAKFLENYRGNRPVEAWKNFEQSLKANQVSSLIYVPGIGGYQDGGIVRLDMICTVAVQLLDDALRAGSRIGSFTQNGFYVLLMKLTHYLTRTESAEAIRR